MRVTSTERLAHSVFESGKRVPVRARVAVHSDVAAESLFVASKHEGDQAGIGSKVACSQDLDSSGREFDAIGMEPIDQEASTKEPG